MDPELISDFLNEAQDLIDAANGDITALEANPEDKDLLNRMFRAFHTVKGGAGFIGIHAVVDLCHKAEDLLSEVRSGALALDDAGIDAVARALMQTEHMLGQLAQGADIDPAPEEIMQALHAARYPDGKSSGDEINEDDFEALLDQLYGEGGAPGVSVAAPAAAITAPETEAAPAPKTPSPAPRATEPAKADKSGGEAAPKKGSAPAEAPVRVDAKRLDQLMDLVGELVLVRNRLKAQPEGLDEVARRAVAELDHVTGALQRSVMAVRMQPVGRLFSRIPRQVRELARSLGKKVEVELEGESAELDKHMLDALSDPLVHLVRNSLDHGIENPAERQAAGKPEAGTLTVSARQAGDHIEIDLIDDGKGIDPEVVKKVAVARGVITADAAAAMDTETAQGLIFAAGFSTRESVSDVSGRGVGMDVVNSRIVELGGSVSLQSEVGQGTRIRLRLPLTLAVLPSLMVRVADRVFALPLAEVRELSSLNVEQVEQVGHRWQLPLEKNVLPLRFMRGWMAGDESTHPGLIVQTFVEQQPWGLVVDSVIGREDIVVRPLAKHLRHIPGYSGATVTGRGEVALVLDPQSLIRAGAYRRVAA
ncbi:chemotaxis protein CheA [Algiphilus sp.]|uniref:chemotaxis protein CheA n=1 Tax=Algiphilus sp. TaxID=1872431 RepID=UPI003B52C252